MPEKVVVHSIGGAKIGRLNGAEAWYCEVEMEIDGARRSVPIFGEDAAQARHLAERFGAKVTGQDSAPEDDGSERSRRPGA